MALFSTLVSSDGGDDESSSISSMPTVIQLSTSSNSMILADPTAKAAHHAVLSYQAVEVGSAGEEASAALFGHKRKKEIKKSNIKPNLGVWNCCVSPGASSSLVDRLLDVPSNAGTVPTFCFTVSLQDPTRVERGISSLQESLVRHLIRSPPFAKVVPPSATTSLYDLRLAQFGLAPEDDGGKLQTTAPNVSEKQVMFALMICVIVPSSASETDAYKQKQAQALLFYHLRRYAAALKATLCLVSANDESTSSPPEGSPLENNQTQPTMTVDQVSQTWLELASGRKVVVKQDADGDSKVEQPQDSSAYSPGMQDDLIETVLLRNAHYEGEWDASKDSLWVALPPVDSQQDKVAEQPNKSGDEVWLSQLRESIGSLLATTPAPPVSKEKSKEPSDKPQGEEDADVSSFFENLLKKN